MPQKTVHVMQRSDGPWVVQREGTEQAIAVLDSLLEAIAVGRRLLAELSAEWTGELRIHSQEPQIH